MPSAFSGGRSLMLGWKMLGLEQRLGSRIVTYADDLVILCRRGKADEALQQLRKIMGKLKLRKFRCPCGEARSGWCCRTT